MFTSLYSYSSASASVLRIYTYLPSCSHEHLESIYKANSISIPSSSSASPICPHEHCQVNLYTRPTLLEPSPSGGFLAQGMSPLLLFLSGNPPSVSCLVLRSPASRSRETFLTGTIVAHVAAVLVLVGSFAASQIILAPFVAPNPRFFGVWLIRRIRFRFDRRSRTRRAIGVRLLSWHFLLGHEGFRNLAEPLVLSSVYDRRVKVLFLTIAELKKSISIQY